MAPPPGLSPAAWRRLLLGAVCAASVGLPFAAGSLGDYPHDAQGAIDALSAGHVSAFLGAHPDMGAVSILLRAPLVALGGGNDLLAYRLGAILCLLAAGILGLYLARLAADRGANWLSQAAIAAICLLNPLTLNALAVGHPEEVFTAALAVGAVAMAGQGKAGRATLLLGLAVASKQWAVIAVLPVLMALPAGRLRAGLGAAGIALALTLPFLLANPDGFLTTHRSLAFQTEEITRWSVWYPVTHVTQAYDPDAHLTFGAYRASPWVAKLSHPLILLVAFAVPLALAWRRRSMHLSGADALALLALLALLRCALDPVNNLYYHEPFLLALVGWDALASRGLPLRALGGTLALELAARWLGTSASSFGNALYLSLAVGAALAIAFDLFRRRDPRTRGGSVALEAAGGIAGPPLVRS